MRVLTFNLWHGLSPSGPVVFEALEPDARRRIRQQIQVEILGRIGADICFLQEVNPVAVRAGELAARLDMRAEVQPDLVGLKLFGYGLPVNLNSGLCTLTSRMLPHARVAAVSLTRPGLNLVRSWASWQLSEERFALFSESLVPEWGRILMVNTHLHHGLEFTPEYARELEKLGGELELSPAMMSELKTRLLAGNRRRTRELDVILRTVSKYERRYEVILLGGDFNATPDHEIGRKLEGLGFVDVWRAAHANEPGWTYDPTVNVGNHILQSRFPLTLTVEDLSFSPAIQDALVTQARRFESRPRRIDHLWVRTQGLKVKAESVRLVGMPDASGMAPSDHFGVCADLVRA